MDWGFLFLMGTVMARTIFFIDGFNLYHSLVDPQTVKRLGKYKWLNLKNLCEIFLETKDQLVDIYYFTAICSWDSGKAFRHELFIAALENTGVMVVKGKFKLVTKKCRATCKERFKTHEEKRTDVSIGVKLFSLAGSYDKAFILTADSDLIPAVQEVKHFFPDKKIICILPFGKSANELKSICDESRKIKEKHLSTSLFNFDITLSNGKVISCPDKWK